MLKWKDQDRNPQWRPVWIAFPNPESHPWDPGTIRNPHSNYHKNSTEIIWLIPTTNQIKIFGTILPLTLLKHNFDLRTSNSWTGFQETTTTHLWPISWSTKPHDSTCSSTVWWSNRLSFSIKSTPSQSRIIINYQPTRTLSGPLHCPAADGSSSISHRRSHRLRNRDQCPNIPDFKS